jgi:hypothetical protein
VSNPGITRTDTPSKSASAHTNAALISGLTPGPQPAAADARSGPVFASPPFADFSDARWTVVESGGSELGKGSVSASNGSALLREGDSFTVTLSYPFKVPENATTLSFTYADLNFDTMARNFVKDAFEAALLDTEGRSLVYPIEAGRDVFFNISETVPTAMGQQVTVNGNTVSVDVTGLFPGTDAVLLFRLVNNDKDTATSVRIVDVNLSTSQANRPPVAHAGGPYDVDLGVPLQLDGSRSSDPDQPTGDSIATYVWDVDNDGQFDDASGANPTLSADQLQTLGVGTHTVSLQVADTFGLQSTAAATLRIFDNRPFASFTANPNPAEFGASVTMDASGSTHGRPDRSIVIYQWDFDFDGGRFDVESTGVSVGHVFPIPGAHTVALRVTDNNDPAKSATTTLVVNVLAPEPQDVTELVEVKYFGTQVNTRGRTVSFQGTITNKSSTALSGPVRLMWNNLQPATAVPLNTDGILEDGTPYFDVTGLVPGSTLDPGETTQARLFTVQNPTLGPMNFDSVLTAVVVGVPAVGASRTEVASDQEVTTVGRKSIHRGNRLIQAIGRVGAMHGTSPAVEILSPDEVSPFAAGTTVLVSGTASDPVTVNGLPVDTMDAAGNFFTQVFVAPGQNAFEFTATDSFGQTATETLTLLGLASAAPEINFDLLSDTSASFEPDYRRTSFNQFSDILYAELAVK